jgi:hypothetical protein
MGFFLESTNFLSLGDEYFQPCGIDDIFCMRKKSDSEVLNIAIGMKYRVNQKFVALQN